MNQTSKVTALLTLLQDEDLKVASLAMEQFLKLGHVADETIAEYQESHDPRLRHRIHQLSSIMTRRRARMEFVQALSQEKLSLWEGVQQINTLYDPQCNCDQIENGINQIVSRFDEGTSTTPRIAALMRDLKYTMPEEDILDVDLFLIERVLDSQYGSPALLCVLAKQVARETGLTLTIVLHEGRFCLIDKDNLLLDPAEGWHISKLKATGKIHPCGRRDVLLGILSQLFLIALVEGQLRELYHFGSLLTALNGNDLDTLPYPLGGKAPGQPI